MNIQLVLCPYINDGDELIKTLDYLEKFSNVKTIGLIPVGYTKYSNHIHTSYSDDKLRAQQLIADVEAFKDCSTHAKERIQLADEFYISAGLDFPSSQEYAGYPLLYDGVGMMRKFIDEWHTVYSNNTFASEKSLHVVCGEAFASVLTQLIEETNLQSFIIPVPVHNSFFGGNVDVSGLLTACDVRVALDSFSKRDKILIPRVMFNDDGLTLDDYTFEQLQNGLSCQLKLTSYSPEEILSYIK